MDLADIDPRLVGQGPMSHVSYDSHVVTRRRMADELPRVKQQQGEGGGLLDLGAGPGLSGAETSGYTEQMMDGEIQRVSRELYKAFSGKNPGFAEVSYSQHLHHYPLIQGEGSDCDR